MKLFDVTQTIIGRIAGNPVLYEYWTRRAGRLSLPSLAAELENAFVRTLTPQAVPRIYRDAQRAWLRRRVDWMALAGALISQSMAGEIQGRFPQAGARQDRGVRVQRASDLRARAA